MYEAALWQSETTMSLKGSGNKLTVLGLFASDLLILLPPSAFLFLTRFLLSVFVGQGSLFYASLLTFALC